LLLLPSSGKTRKSVGRRLYHTSIHSLLTSFLTFLLFFLPSVNFYITDHLLLLLSSGKTRKNVGRRLQQLDSNVFRSAEVSFSREVMSVLNDGNFVRFFRMARAGTLLQAIVLRLFFAEVRVGALYTLSAALSRGRSFVEAKTIARWLCFDDADAAAAFCAAHGFVTSYDATVSTIVSVLSYCVCLVFAAICYFVPFYFCLTVLLTHSHYSVPFFSYARTHRV
jgi:hypothetical protein